MTAISCDAATEDWDVGGCKLCEGGGTVDVGVTRGGMVEGGCALLLVEIAFGGCDLLASVGGDR